MPLVREEVTRIDYKPRRGESPPSATTESEAATECGSLQAENDVQRGSQQQQAPKDTVQVSGEARYSAEAMEHVRQLVLLSEELDVELIVIVGTARPKAGCLVIYARDIVDAPQ